MRVWRAVKERRKAETTAAIATEQVEGVVATWRGQHIWRVATECGVREGERIETEERGGDVHEEKVARG